MSSASPSSQQSPGPKSAKSQRKAPGPAQKQARRMRLAGALRQAGKTKQAARLANCGRVVEVRDPQTGEAFRTQWPYCWMSICPRCGWRRAAKRARAWMRRIAEWERINQEYLSTLREKRPGLRRAFDSILEVLRGFRPARGQVGDEKTALVARLQGLKAEILALAELWVNPSTPVKWVKRAVGQVHSRGRRGIGEAMVCLDRARETLEEALARRTRYTLQHITLTSAVTDKDFQDQMHSHRCKVGRFRRQVSVPGMGIIAAEHLQPNPHTHLLRSGDRLDKKAVRQLWKAITGNSDQVSVKQANDPKGLLRYMFGPSPKVDPETVVRLWQATDGMRRTNVHGTLNPRTKLGRKAPQIQPSLAEAEAAQRHALGAVEAHGQNAAGPGLGDQPDYRGAA